MKRTSQEIKISNKTLTLESDRFAFQANAAVMAKLGDTLILSTVVSSSSQEDLDYFPLSVDYIERLYAGGRIKGSRWVKREGRPSDEAILNARLIDRSIRPLFPKGYKNRVQVVITVLSVDAENNPDVLALVATSAALSISDIPWNGPVGGVRLGFVPKDGEEGFVVNPTYQDLEYSDMDLVLAGTKDALIMAEGQAQEISEKTLASSLDFSLEQIKSVVKGIEDFSQKFDVKKQIFEKETVDQELVNQVKKEVGKDLKKAVTNSALNRGGISLGELKEVVYERLPEEKRGEIKKAVEQLAKEIVRKNVVEKSERIDGRKFDQVRPIEVGVDLLPRTHGSAMFKRGKTQALTVATLGALSLEQRIESMEGEETKRYMHHYYMPPFSVGETGRLGWPSRREVGHGVLAEKAIEPVLPSEEKFPYAIRLVSEILSSNGSTSMAAVCGSSLSLMDAGVPIKSPVAGIAMGLVVEGKKKVVLSDILGFEDFQGDMDFKVAGTESGITAVQLDVKNTNIPVSVLKQALKQAKKGRQHILERMQSVLPASRAQVSKFAPKIEVIHIDPEKIGDVVGSGGRVIKRIISESGASVDIEDDGSVNISSPDKKAVEKAAAMIEGITREVEVGDEFTGEVKRIEPFGAFVEIAPGKEGLVHISQMSTRYVKDPENVVSVGDKVKVWVREIDERKRINLTMLPKDERRKKRSSKGKKHYRRSSFGSKSSRSHSSSRNHRK